MLAQLILLNKRGTGTAIYTIEDDITLQVLHISTVTYDW